MFGKMSLIRLSTRLVPILLLIALLAAPVFAALPARAQGDWEVVASGLNNPRGLTFDGSGALYVAEAGTGGADCHDFFPPSPDPDTCIGTTGSVTRVWGGQQTRFSEGYASLADPSGFGATGLTDLSFHGPFSAFGIVGLGADPALRDELANTVNPLFGKLGWLVMISKTGRWRNQVDVSAYEAAANPDGGPVDSNPYSVLAHMGKAITADAGGNDLLRVSPKGPINSLAIFPPATWVVPDPPPFPDLPPPGTEIPVDAVPTSVVLGPDGYYYVGQLASVATGDANVYRVSPRGGEPQEYVSGLTAIIDIAFAPDGSLYVLEIFKNGLLAGELFGDMTGALLHVATDGTVTEIASEGLVAPGGLAVGSDGYLYVSNYSIFPGMGEVVKISPDGGDTLRVAPSGAMRPVPEFKGSLLRLFGVDLSKLGPSFNN